jgi:Ca2+/Na+ antiporter
MTLQEAQELWSDQPLSIELSADVLHDIIKESDALSRTIWFRNIREWAATLLVFAVFLWVALIPGTPTAWFVSAAFVALIPGLYLVVSQMQSRKEQKQAVRNNREHIESAVRKYLRQETLLNGVVIWYLAPLFVSALLFIVGTALNIPDFPWQARVALLVVQVGFCLILFAGVAWLNIRVSRTRLRPRREELEAILSEVAS